MKMRASMLVLLLAAGAGAGARAENTVAIGDSLTAEYDTIPEIAGFPTEATAYAEVTVPGWVSRSWVEVLAKLRPGDFEFGSKRPLSDPFPPPRLSGYSRNWAVPGIEAALYEEFLTVGVQDNPFYAFARRPLEDQLRGEAERVAIWLGTNEFRARYGPISDGASAAALIDGLLDDLEDIVDFVKNRAGDDVQIGIANLPDLGATPDKQEAHPDPEKRALVTAAVAEANTRIAELAADEGIALIDAHAVTVPLVAGRPTYFGAVELDPDANDDNEPRHLFTRDGLHPNTSLQIRVARQAIMAFNQRYGAGIRQITDYEALRFLRIDPNAPYVEWIGASGAKPRGFLKDPDGDGMKNLMEYAFGLNPGLSDRASLPATRGGAAPGFDGTVSVTYRPDASRARHVTVQVQYSTDGSRWKKVPNDRVVDQGDGSFIAAVPALKEPILTRIKVLTIPPKGYLATVVTATPVE